MKFSLKALIATLAICILLFPWSFLPAAPLVEAIRIESKKPRNTAAIDVTQIVSDFISKEMSEEAATTLLRGAGFHEYYRSKEKNPFDTNPTKSEEYLVYRFADLNLLLLFSKREYTVQLGISDQKVDRMHASVRWYTMGIN